MTQTNTVTTMRTRIHFVLVLLFLNLHCSDALADEESPEYVFRRTVSAWRSSPNNWLPWLTFSSDLSNRFEESSENRLEIIGAMEEGILAIERIIFQNGEGENPPRDNALSRLYSTYGSALSNLSAKECLELALDPHTLLIGAETVDRNTPSTHLCIENAENSLRNAVSLDATNKDADQLLQTITGEDSAHKRKPKEFVAELFDSFADTFDDKLLNSLQYKVPGLVGGLAKKLSGEYNAVLDAGCGTGLAGRYLRPLVPIGAIVGVDASQKMLDKAASCTIASGCGLDTKVDGGGNSPPLYDALLKMDLEEMTIDNVLTSVVKDAPVSFDLIVAADVLVYFGSLEKLLSTFARLSSPGARLIFSCELATNNEAPLGWRLLASGRFAHSKSHVVETTSSVGYELVHYEEIVPRMEKGEPVRGHLFALELKSDHFQEEL